MSKFVVHCESSGLPTATYIPRLLAIAWCDENENSKHYIIKPTFEYDSSTFEKYNGITSKMLEDGYDIKYVLGKFLEDITGKTLLAHQMHKFNLPILMNELKLCALNMPTVTLLEIDSKGMYGWYKDITGKDLDRKDLAQKVIGTVRCLRKAGDKKIYLNVSFDDKEKAKGLGCRWDAAVKKWYVYNADNPACKIWGLFKNLDDDDEFISALRIESKL